MLLHFSKYQHVLARLQVLCFCVDGSSLEFFVFFAQIWLLFYFLDKKIEKNQSPMNTGLESDFNFQNKSQKTRFEKLFEFWLREKQKPARKCGWFIKEKLLW
jgi:hypothetical protein